MAKRSTRNKLKYQAEHAIKNVLKSQQHLKNMDDMAAGRHPVIKRSLPGIVEMSQLLLDTLKAFRASL